jgi:hypothetical protein
MTKPSICKADCALCLHGRQEGEDEVDYGHLVTGEVTMKIIAAIILGLGIGLAIGWTTTALASSIQQNTNQDRIAALEARLQALEYLRWTKNHAINAVSYKVFERSSSCDIEKWGGSCYLSDPVLQPFASIYINGEWVNPGYSQALARKAYHYGEWYAQDKGDGDSWNVWVIMKIKNQDGTYTEFDPFTWTVWESNGYIQAAQ